MAISCPDNNLARKLVPLTYDHFLLQTKSKRSAMLANHLTTAYCL